MNSAFVVQHEAYGPPPGGGGGGGGVRVPAGPANDGDGGGGLVVEFESSEDFERSAPQIAQASHAHRMHAREELGQLLARVIGLNDAPDRQDVLSRIVVTSDVATFEAIDQLAAEVGAELGAAQDESRLDLELLADAMGVAAWAIGADVGDELSVDAIEMIPDRRLQFLLRASNLYARESAGAG